MWIEVGGWVWGLDAVRRAAAGWSGQGLQAGSQAAATLCNEVSRDFKQKEYCLVITCS